MGNVSSRWNIARKGIDEVVCSERATSLDFIGHRINEKRNMNSNLQNANDAVFYYTVRLSVYIFHKNLYLHENLQTLTIFIRKKS